jgi:hypothetical protein
MRVISRFDKLRGLPPHQQWHALPLSECRSPLALRERSSVGRESGCRACRASEPDPTGGRWCPRRSTAARRVAPSRRVPELPAPTRRVQTWRRSQPPVARRSKPVRSGHPDANDALGRDRLPPVGTSPERDCLCQRVYSSWGEPMRTPPTPAPPRKGEGIFRAIPTRRRGQRTRREVKGGEAPLRGSSGDRSERRPGGPGPCTRRAGG